MNIVPHFCWGVLPEGRLVAISPLTRSLSVPIVSSEISFIPGAFGTHVHAVALHAIILPSVPVRRSVRPSGGRSIKEGNKSNTARINNFFVLILQCC